MTANHLAAVPDDQPPDDQPDPHDVAITDTDISFVGAIGTISLDKKTSGLVVPIVIDPLSPLSHHDVARLRYRHLQVTITPVARTRDGNVTATDPREDPVRRAVMERNAERMVDSWVTGDLAGHPHHVEGDG